MNHVILILTVGVIAGRDLVLSDSRLAGSVSTGESFVVRLCHLRAPIDCVLSPSLSI